MESQEQEYSYFLGGENYLESVIEAYFNLRPVEDEPEDDNCDDFSSDEEGDQDVKKTTNRTEMYPSTWAKDP